MNRLFGGRISGILLLLAVLAMLVIFVLLSAIGNSPDEACPHGETAWRVDTEPTKSTYGQQSLVCSLCGKSLDTETIDRLPLSEDEITAKLSPSVVKVICYDKDGKTKTTRGSGFFIDTNGLFITNSHVVKNCFFIKIETSQGEIYDVDIMYSYSYISSDYAICRAKKCTSVAVEFSDKAEVGDTVYAIGYPGRGDVLKTTSGVITNTDVKDGKRHYYSNTAETDHGSSGGALTDDRGRVIGITTGAFPDNSGYAALRYIDLAEALTDPFTGGKAPWEYFHTEDELSPGDDNNDQ